ncbi:uncharacterized protein TNCV_4037021 [Trichonephila clavipes]|nr:uncharacterized protein TNCV_4037021 [Trichonephila clavipes]
MSSCGREFHIACMRSESSSFEAAGRGSRLARLCAHEPIADATVDGPPVRGILYKGTLARNPRCSKRQRIDKADINSPVAVDQRAANCLEEVVRSFTAMRSRYRSSRTDVTFRRPLPVFRVVLYSSAHCFQTHITVKLFRCTRTPIV